MLIHFTLAQMVYSGKLQYIRDQMKALQLNFLGIQESRAPAVCATTDHILRLGSGADRGHFGVELWLNMQQPIAHVKGQPVYVGKQHVAVVHAAPRVLLCHLVHELWNAWILVAHAPQSGQSSTDRQLWWQALNHVVQEYVTDGHLFVLLDANAGGGPTDGVVVGPFGLPATKSTEFFRTFLDTWSLALPCTFSCHQGDRHTWTSPDGTLQTCIDYVVIPQSHLSSCSLSRVLNEFELGNGENDHNAVAIQLLWQDSHTQQVTSTARKKYDRDLIKNETIASQLEQFAVPAWCTDVYSQVEQHNQHIIHCLRSPHLRRANTAKKSFITEEIWHMRVNKLHCAKTVKEIGKRLKQELVRAVFLGWKHHEPEWHWTHASAYQQYVAALRCWKLHHGALLHCAASRLRLRLKRARRQALNQDLTQCPSDTSAPTILHIVKKHMGPTNLKALKKPTLPMLHTLDGEVCTTPDQLMDTWIAFFGAMEGGQRVTFEELYAVWRTHLAAARQKQLALGPEDIPCLTDLEQAYRRVKRGKALGQDDIPPEVCGACPTTLAKQTFSVLLKMMAHGQESLHHKGGTLVPAYKGKGSTLAPTSYRSLLISSHPGKALHRTVRQHQTQLYEQYLCRQQLGGRQHVPVNLGLHEARAFLRRGQSHGLSVGLLMLDLTEAFYRVLRPLAVGCPWTDDQIATLAQKLGMSDTALHDLYRHLQEPSALDRAQLPAHMQRIIKSLHTDTYFQVPGQRDFCHTTIGSRPGDCFADVVFSYLFSRVLHDFQAQVQALGLQEMLPVHQQFDPFQTQELSYATGDSMPYMGPVWMDDLCIGITAPTPDALISKAGTMTAILLETLEGYGMTPNLKRGKTELLLSLRGSGMRRCRRELFGPQSDGTLPVICESGVKFISVVGQYQHLGGLIHHAGDHRQEMRRRIAIANEAFNAHRRTIYQNLGIPLCKRIELFHTLILSKLLYGCESWVLATIRDKEYLHAAIMRLYRRLDRSHPTDHRTDQEVCTALQLPTPTELLRQVRLRYLGTVHACQHVVTWALFNQDQEWTALIRDDLTWMWTQLSNSSALQDPHRHFAAWRYLWCYHNRYWKGLIKRAAQHSILQRHNESVVCAAHHNILVRLVAEGLIQRPEDPMPRCPVQQPPTFGCLQCNKSFKSKGGEGAHMFRCHQIISSIRYLFDETRCSFCLKEYHTYSRLHNHLRHSHECRLSLQSQHGRCTPVSGHGSQENNQQERKHNGLLPPLISQGPRLPPPRLREVADFDVDLYGECAEIMLVYDEVDIMLQEIPCSC